MIKYNGWAFQTAYMLRNTPDAITTHPEDNSNQRIVIAGNGYDTQLSYNLINNIELIGRYSYSTPKKQIQAFLPQSNQYSIGITKYIWEHAFKIQAEATFEQLQFLSTNQQSENWYVRFQIEIGI